jgi:hypothetical protein
MARIQQKFFFYVQSLSILSAADRLVRLVIRVCRRATQTFGGTSAMLTARADQFNQALLCYFEDTTLALYLDHHAARVFGFGSVRKLTAGETLPAQPDHVLHVIMEGRLVSRRTWYGPGNHLTVSEPLQADGDVTLWALDLESARWCDPDNLPLRRTLAKALIAADTAEAAVTLPAELPDPATLCDVDHPEIRRQAVRLRRATQEHTAEAIFLFVQAMPYRFGMWQEPASATLARGTGMCTTKANLQVALLRAAGLEAGYVEFPMDMCVLGKLMPIGWRPMMREQVKHYFAAVKLGGRWHAADASYSDGAMAVYGQTIDNTELFVPAWLGEGRPYSPCHYHAQRDPFDIEVQLEIHDVMGKRSRFLPRHFESLNVGLDRAQNSHRRWAHEAGLDWVEDATA